MTTKLRRTGPREVALPPTLTVKHLADLMRVSPIDVIKQLMRNGVMAAINQVIDFDLAAMVTPAFGFKATPEERASGAVAAAVKDVGDVDADALTPRSPVVTIFGHVDHGKTTLLDTIRDSRITEREVGGITQHIGAYQVDYKGQKITFLDTPGHEAFTAIRARGASVTDIAVLVVAADDGVMPQTVEAIDHARAADLPIVVAINKVDKPDAVADRVKRQLVDHGLLLEEWGGDVIGVPVSAKNKTGIDDLLENILVVAEVAEFKADAQRPASGVVIESQLDRNKGPLATVLVQNGTLKVGDSLVAGTAWGRVKAMVNDLRRRVKEAGPSVPVEIMGFGSLPQAGDRFYVTANSKTARALVEENIVKSEEEQNLARALTLEDVMSRITAGDVKELSLILKADAQGSVEAVSGALERLDSPSARLNLLHAGAGSVNESDVLLASASNAIILAFNVGIEPSAEPASEREGVEIRSYDIIYQIIEDVEKALKGILEPSYREVVQGKATIRTVFSAGKAGKVAGVVVNEGRLTRNVALRVLRDGVVVLEGSISSLRRFKEDVNEVGAGFECGVGISGFADFREGDVLQAHKREKSRA
jgi:translation initiation factor IF-2